MDRCQFLRSTRTARSGFIRRLLNHSACLICSPLWYGRYLRIPPREPGACHLDCCCRWSICEREDNNNNNNIIGVSFEPTVDADRWLEISLFKNKYFRIFFDQQCTIPYVYTVNMLLFVSKQFTHNLSWWQSHRIACGLSNATTWGIFAHAYACVTVVSVISHKDAGGAKVVN